MLGISTGTETIVLLASEPETRRLISQMLSLAGYTVREASDGAEALRQIEAGIHTADLLLADIAAPAMSGGDLAERLKQQYPNLRVLLTAELRDDQAIQNALPGGAQVLAKPFSPGALMSKVREVLDGPFACAAARQAAASGGYPTAG